MESKRDRLAEGRGGGITDAARTNILLERNDGMIMYTTLKQFDEAKFNLCVF
jgi:hypothetical protein